jgi:predicted amidohydrolase YtcJ
VEEPNPFWGIHAAVTRHKNDGSPYTDGWIPEERITLLEAFTAYTRGAAFASGQEIDVGRLDFGYFGDLVVFDTNPFEIEIDGLKDLKPVGTMVGGVWRVKSF